MIFKYFKIPKNLAYAIKIAFIISIVFVLMRFIEINEMKRLFLQISIPLFSLIFLFATIDQIILGLKWNILLKAFNVHVPVYAPIVACLRGKVFKLFIPTSIGVDIYKSYYIKKYGYAITHIISSIIVERFVGMLSSVAIILLLFHFVSKAFIFAPSKIITIGGIVGFAGICVGLYMILGNILKIQQITIPNFFPFKLKRFINDFFKAITVIKSRRSCIMKYFVFSMGEKLFFGTCIYFSAKSIGLEEISYLYIISASPFLALLERLPFSVSAIGIREGLFVVLLRPYSIDTTTAVSVALTLRSAELCLIFVCLVFWLINGKNDKFSLDLLNLKRNNRL